MSFKIGFTAGTEKDNPCISENTQHNKKTIHKARESVVDVFFPDRHLTCSYYNDTFDLKRGDIVYVDGKLEGLQGRVVSVSYNFKIKLSDYKRVIGVANTDVAGELFMAGSHFIAIDHNVLPYEQVITWFKAPTPEDEEFASSSDDEVFNLNDLSGMKIDKATADRGLDYFLDGEVVYIELKNDKGRAIVCGSKPYEVEFYYRNGDVSGLICDCYCAGTCKHEFAAMLQLRETLKTIDQEYGDDFELDYLAIVSKPIFFQYVIDNRTNGSFTMN